MSRVFTWGWQAWHVAKGSFLGLGARVTPHSHAGAEVRAPTPGCPQLPPRSALLQEETEGAQRALNERPYQKGGARGV